MSKRSAVLLLCAALLAAGGCAHRESGSGKGQEYLIYYSALSNRESESAVAGEHRALSAGQETVPALMSLLLSQPESAGLTSPFPSGLRLLDWQLEEGRLHLDLSDHYYSLSGVDLTLADACLALTFCQLEEVDSVYVTVEGHELPYRAAQQLSMENILLAGGADVVYPPSNRELYEDVAAAGCVLSESPPGTPAEGWRFPVRNRILSGLSVGVAVVEAAEHSGALITARRALDQSRDVFAVPGPVDAPMSAGTNGLIARGEAKLIRSAQDILVEYETRFPHKVRRPPHLTPAETRARLGMEAGAPRPAPRAEETGEERPAEEAGLPLRPRSELEGLGDEQRQIFFLLSERALVPDEIVGRTEIPARRVNTALTLLQAQGYVTELPGRRFAAAVRFPDTE